MRHIHGCTLTLEEATVVLSETTNVANCLTPYLLQGTERELGSGFAHCNREMWLIITTWVGFHEK